MSVDLKRALHLADKHDAEAYYETGVAQKKYHEDTRDTLRALADEVERLRKTERKEMDEDLFWALKGKCELMEREDEVWKSLLEAVKMYVDSQSLPKLVQPS